jgi:hypothetical protein
MHISEFHKEQGMFHQLCYRQHLKDGSAPRSLLVCHLHSVQFSFLDMAADKGVMGRVVDV